MPGGSVGLPASVGSDDAFAGDSQTDALPSLSMSGAKSSLNELLDGLSRRLAQGPVATLVGRVEI